MKKINFILLMFFVLMPFLSIKAFTPLSLEIYNLTETVISPNGDGTQDSADIDIKYSEEVSADINILDSNGSLIKVLYHDDSVTNPHPKTWDGKNTAGEIVSNGTYTIQILGTATADPENTLSDISKTITVNVPSPASTATFIIRNGSSEIYRGTVPLLADKSVLATLQSIDGTSDAFSISNIQDFSFGKYLKCILPSSETELCDNWQFSVGSVSPFTSIDTTLLSGGETVGIYFGNSHQLVLNKDTINSGESINATAQKYNYENNTWNPLTSVSVGVTLPNPADPWNPIIVSTHPVDGSGVANITITGANTYTLGITEDFYFPSYTVTVSASQNSVEVVNSGSPEPLPIFNVLKALAYLKSVQSTDGSFGGSDLYTDWAGIALGSQKVTDDSKEKIINYFSANNKISDILTDNERRAIALLALGQNPYSFNGADYITAIIKSFDGAQFGDVNLINDDIFALIPLKNSGYDENDEIIVKDIAFIISKQKTNGSFEESIDITAAAIQALKPFEKIAGVFDSILKAKNYLINEQKIDGGWGNVSSTSWAMQAMNALSLSSSKEVSNANNYLGKQQDLDGAMFPSSDTLSNRIWAVSYALAASTQKPWSEIMGTVIKPAEQKIPKITVENKEKIKTTTAPALSKNIKSKGIAPETLVASTANASPINLPAQAVPFSLGVFSGMGILFLLKRFLFV